MDDPKKPGESPPEDKAVDEELVETFPASDAPAHTGTTAGNPRREEGGKSSEEEALDEEVDESFPASDPPSHTGTSSGGPPSARRDRRPSGK